MKKLKILLTLLCTAVLFQSLSAQATADIKFGSDETYRSWPYKVSGDTISGTDETGKVFFVGKPYEYKYFVEVGADNLTAGSTDFILYGSNNGDRYYTISSVTWSMTTSDTTVIFDSGSTYVRWRYLKSTIKGNSVGTRARYGPAGVMLSK